MSCFFGHEREERRKLKMTRLIRLEAVGEGQYPRRISNVRLSILMRITMKYWTKLEGTLSLKRFIHWFFHHECPCTVHVILMYLWFSMWAPRNFEVYRISHKVLKKQWTTNCVDFGNKIVDIRSLLCILAQIRETSALVWVIECWGCLAGLLGGVTSFSEGVYLPCLCLLAA